MSPLKHIPTQERDELLEPVRHLTLFRRDAASFHFVSELDRWTDEDVAYATFTFSTSMGSGGGLFHGDSDRAVGMARRPGFNLPRAYLRPRTVLNRLSWLLEGDRTLERIKDRALGDLLIHGTPGHQVMRVVMPAVAGLELSRLGISVETDGDALVVYGRSRLKAEVREGLEALVGVLLAR